MSDRILGHGTPVTPRMRRTAGRNSDGRVTAAVERRASSRLRRIRRPVLEETSRTLGGSGRGVDLAGFGEPGGDFAELDVQLLRGPPQHIECFLRCDAETFHQNAFRLTDDVSG
jgi:hypothetical protein